MLVETFDGEPRIDHGIHHLGQRVQPFMRHRMRDLRGVAGVGRLLAHGQRLVRRVLPVEADLQVIGLLVDLHEGGVAFEQVEPAARLQQRGGNAGPAAHIRQPADGAPGDIDHVEVALDQLPRVIDVALDESGVEPGLLLQPARRGNGVGRKVEAHAAGAAPGEAQRVDADVALQVRDAQAADFADLIMLDVVEIVRAGEEGGEAIAAGLVPDVDVGAVVPVQAVLREIAVRHAAFAPPCAAKRIAKRVPLPRS